MPEEPVIYFEDLRFPTPSGRIELASERAERDGHPRVPRPTFDAPPAGGRLRLLSPADAWLMNDSYANDARIADRLGPEPTVTLHPADARAFGLVEGDRARLANETGAIHMRVRVADVVPEGTALTHKGRWPKREAEGRNVNALNPGHKTDMGESTCVHAVEVSLARAVAAE
jgi:anaerobic selenocysteine-containing dehydrogenase